MAKKKITETEYIKLYRKMTEWEWYDKIPEKVVFLHLLLTANWKEGRFRGVTIKPGQTVTSYSKIAEETGLSYKQVRNAVQTLIRSGELKRADSWADNWAGNRADLKKLKFGLYTIANWERYQVVGQDNGHNNGHDNGQKKGRTRATIEEDNKDIDKSISKEEKKKYLDPLTIDTGWEPEGGWDG